MEHLLEELIQLTQVDAAMRLRAIGLTDAELRSTVLRTNVWHQGHFSRLSS